MASSVEPRPTNPAAEFNKSIATLRESLDKSHQRNEKNSAEITKLLTKQTALIETDYDLIIGCLQREYNRIAKHYQKAHDSAIELLKREHEIHVGELTAAHAAAAAKLNGEMAALREELATLRAKHTGHEGGAGGSRPGC
jgi:hypothetical protein